MNRSEFVDEVAKRKGVSRETAYKYVNGVMDTIRIVLLQGEEIEIGGFGTFGVVTDLRGNHIPVFKVGQAFSRVLNAVEKRR